MCDSFGNLGVLSHENARIRAAGTGRTLCRPRCRSVGPVGGAFAALPAGSVRAGWVVGGGVAGEQVERVVGWRPGCGNVDEQALALVGHREGLVREVEVTHHGVVQSFGAGGVDADVVAGPAGAELLTARREFADEVGQVAVVGVAAGLCLQDGDGVVSSLAPVAEELPGAGVEEGVPGAVGTAFPRAEDG